MLALGACGSDDEPAAPDRAPPGGARGLPGRRSSTSTARRRSSPSPSEWSSPACASRTRCWRSASCRSRPPSGTASTPARSSPGPRTSSASAQVPTVLSDEDGLDVEKIAAQRPGPDRRRLLGHDAQGVRHALQARARRRPATRQGRLRLELAGGDADERQGRRPARARAGARRRDRGADRRRRSGAPGVQGQTAANVSDYQGVFVYGPQDERSRMLEQLGFEYPDALRDAFPDDFGGQLSDEKLDALDVGALLWFADGDRSVEELKNSRSTASCACASRPATCSSTARTASTRRPRSPRC